MSRSRFNIVEDGAIVSLYTPVDMNDSAGMASPVVVSMRNFAHATIITSLALPKAAGVITVNSCSNFVPTVSTAIPFRYYRYETNQMATGGDIPGALTWATAVGGIVPVATGTPALYVIELDAEELLAGHVGFRLLMVDPGAASVGTSIAILSGARYAWKGTTNMGVV